MKYFENSFWAHGDKVRVVRGKKYPVGLEGTLFWYGPGSYRKNRAGINTEAFGAIFIDAGNIRNLDFEAREDAEAKAHAEKMAAEKATREEAAKLFGKRESKFKSASGWRDDYEVELELLKPEVSDEEIKKAVHIMHPTTSSWGALRWRAGIYDIKVDREKNVVSFIDSTGLAD